MFHDVNRYVTFISKNRLTQSQFLMCYLLYRKKYDAINEYKTAFPNDDKTMIGESLRQDLVDRDFIRKVADGDRAGAYEVTDKFTHIYFQDMYVAADEVWSRYPGFLCFDGKTIPTTTMDKYKFTTMYGERIDYSVDEHREVLKDLDYAVENNLIKMNIENWVRSENWMKIRQIRCAQQKVVQQRDDANF